MVWFHETLHNGYNQGLEGEEIYKQQTEYQDLRILDNKIFGKVLTLDGVVQTTEKDEFVYHEMMTHPVLFAHPNPEKVLVIGAGDGGILREVLKHDSVKEIHFVEIDQGVIDFSKKYLPILNAGAFDNPKVKTIITDGAKFMEETDERYDVAIVDSTDPIGPSKVLFTQKFYESINRVLKEDGIVIRQTGSSFLQPGELPDQYKILKTIFPIVAPLVIAVPTYIGGFFTLVVGSKTVDVANYSLDKLKGQYNEACLNSKYYNPGVHFGSFQMPNYILDNLK